MMGADAQHQQSVVLKTCVSLTTLAKMRQYRALSHPTTELPDIVI